VNWVESALELVCVNYLLGASSFLFRDSLLSRPLQIETRIMIDGFLFITKKHRYYLYFNLI